MKADYKNWMPKGMVLGFLGGAAAALLVTLVIGGSRLLPDRTIKTVLTVVFAALTLILLAVTLWCFLLYRAFDYNGKRRMSKQIIEGTAAYVKIPKNAKAEGVSNVSFRRGDATHLDFPDETFDAVTSNYVYHNIPSGDRQAILLETLRTLKKGGTFALHDIFSKAKYGDMNAFVRKLENMGYKEVRLIDTTDGIFMKKSEAGWMGLAGSALLTGVK